MLSTAQSQLPWYVGRGRGPVACLLSTAALVVGIAQHLPNPLLCPGIIAAGLGLAIGASAWVRDRIGYRA